MRFSIGLLSATIVIALASEGLAEPVYPIYQTMPHRYEVKSTFQGLKLFQGVGELIKTSGGKDAFIVNLYILKNVDNTEYTLCGAALIGKERKPTVFVVSHEKVYLDVNDDGWGRLGCKTSGGTIVKWVPHSDGSEGNDIRAFYTAETSGPIPPPPAKPPTGPLPLSARVRILMTFENNLSQAMGGEVSITSLRVYDEQNGETTTCVAGVIDAKRKKFRIVQANGQTMGDPTQSQWVKAGCTRPNYQLIH